jgi:hypothetical protein
MFLKSKIRMILYCKVFFVGYSLFNSGCAPSTQIQYISPEYRDRKELSANVMVLQFIPKYFTAIQKEKFYEKKNAEHKYITNNEIELFDNYIAQLLSENMQAKIIRPDNTLDSQNILVQDTCKVKDQKVEIYIPSGIGQNSKTNVPDFIILFTDLYFLKDTDQRGVSMGQGTKTYYLLDGGIEYVIWDYKKKKLAGYGKQSCKVKLLEAPEKEDYLTILERFAETIARNSPIALKKVYF